MSKFLLLVFAAFAVWLLIKRLRRKDATRAAPEPASEQMVTCSHCGLYLPQKEAIAEGGEFFCCAEHQRRSG
ncbi:MAG: PP0621 family protein [Proteobacteria bacterium]|nr:PP0621 family protein [Pseudomonadota bacterium]